MRLFEKILVTISIVFCYVGGDAQNISNKGKEFWVGYGHHQYMEPPCSGSGTASNDMNMVLYLSAEEAAVVTVEIDSSGPFPATWFRKTYNIPANTVISTENLPKGTVDAGPSNSNSNFDARLITDPPPASTGGEGLFRKRGIHIISNVPIVAYAHIYGGVSSGATMLLPIETWGYTYTSTNSEQRDADRSYSWMYVVAKENNTRVEIIPSASSRLGKPAGAPFQVNLQKGQIYQLIGQSDCNTGNGPELTGTTVKSIIGADGNCHAVAVFSGSSRTGGETLTCGNGSGRDNDMQQNFPEQAWGKRYLTAPFSKASSGTSLQPSSFQTSVYKIVVQNASTIVKRNGVALTGLINNKYYKYSSNTADYIEADKPVLVAQFMSGTSSCNGGQGDPEMVYLSPIEQAIKRVGFYRNTKEAIVANYVTLIVPTAGVSSLRIDGSNTFSYTYPVLNKPGYTVVIKGWQATPAQCLVTCDSAFNGITYGLGGAESYGYNVGTYFNNLNAIADFHNTPDTSNILTSHPFAYVETPTLIGALIAYKPTKMVWMLSSISAADLTRNVDTTINNPVPIDSVLIGSAWYYRYRLQSSYVFHRPDSFYIPIKLTSPIAGATNCSNEETANVLIIVKLKPVANFSYSIRGCGKDTINFSTPATVLGQPVIRYKWTFPNGDTSNIQNPQYLLDTGTHVIKLTVVVQYGGLADTTFTIVVPPKPIAKFAANPTTVCFNQPIVFSDNTVYNNIQNWYWDFGNGQITNAPNNSNISINYAAPGTYTIKHAVKVSDYCYSDTIQKTVLVSPKAVIAFTYPLGCLPPSGVAQFGASSTDLGGQAIISYSWNFGDPGSGANNTSTSQNPSHTYTTFGTYTVTLNVTTATGCTGDTTVNIVLNLRPTLSYGALSPICENGVPVSVANGSVTNGVPGTGYYNGPGTSTAGIFTPALAGYGTHTIWYIFTSTGGCKDSVPRTISVFAKPRPAFTFTNTGCLPANGFIQFTNTSTIADGVALTYAWDFGDVNANGSNPNTSTQLNPSHFFKDGTYSIKLTVTSANNCVHDTTITATFRLIPQLFYPALNAVCENITTPVSVATATVTNSVTGTGIYKGPGTDAAGNFSPSVAGYGTHTIWYVFTSASGCIDSTSRTISVSAKPRPAFSFPSGSCLPITGLVQFTNSTTIPDAQTLSYMWNFGDANAGGTNPNTSTQINPTHNFLEGPYSIKLTATSTNGCIADTAITTTFKVTPQLTYPALSPVCESAAGTVSVATASVTNGVTGTGIYKGPGTDAAGNFNPSVAGFGTHIIWYVFTSAGGCIDSTSRTIAVASKPKPSFSFNSSTCLPTTGLVPFTNNSTISDGTSLTYLWNFGDVNATSANPNTSTLTSPSHNFQEGPYSIKLTATSTKGCIADTTINATFKIAPQLNYPALTNVCESITGTVSVATATVINGVTGTGIYRGPGTDAAGNFSPQVAGAGNHTIWYVFTTTGGCKDSTSRTLSVSAGPRAGFTYSGGCLPVTGLVQFTNTSTISNGQTLTYLWNFGDPNATGSNPNTSTLKDPTHNFISGAYVIKLTVNAPNGCSRDTTIIATFSVSPQLAYAAINNVCENVTPFSVASATITNGVTGSGYYRGPGTDSAGMFNPSTAGIGPKTIWYIFTSAGGCKDSISRTFTVYASPRPKFTFSGGCLPINGLVQFTNNTSIADGQLLTYLWNFGDPNASGSNPNTSTLQNPSHNYTSGTYSIKLGVNSSNGCTQDTTITAILSVSPQMVYPYLASVCQSVAGTISVATAGTSNGVTGTGFYRGPGTDSSGNFSPSVAGAGLHTIWYVFTSAGGCKDSISRNIKVYPQPAANFGLSNTGICIDKSVVITNQSTISSGTITKWNWDFGDGTTSVTPGPFTKNFNQANNYNITLFVTSDSGCISATVVKPIVVEPLPIADFQLPGSICMPNGVAQFNNLSSISNNAALTYVWNFGDGSPSSSAASPAHTYTTSTPVSVTLQVTSALGCRKDTTKILSTFYDKPVALFTVTPDTLCQGTQNIFTDLSTAPGGTIQSWQWQFGDGTTSSVKNVTKTFTNPGSYVISLKVTSAQSCVSENYIKNVVVYRQPVIDAGPSYVVALGTVIRFNPVVNDSATLSFAWTPPFGLSNAAALRPTLTALSNQTYKLTATGGPGKCTASDTLTVKVLRPIQIPNAFSPNGDGINDTWQIESLKDYPGAIVEVYNRYGQMIFTSLGGYVKPWDGTYNGKALQVATYYYIIDPKNGYNKMTGSVTILK